MLHELGKFILIEPDESLKLGFQIQTNVSLTYVFLSFAIKGSSATV